MGKYDFGDLNPRTHKQTIREISSDTTGLKYVRSAAINHNKKSSLDSFSPWMAVVYKVFTNAEDMTQSSAKSGFNFWSLFESETQGNIVTIKARIPEIHTFPEPSQVPLNPSSPSYKDDLKILDMYPSFVAKKFNMPVSTVGAWGKGLSCNKSNRTKYQEDFKKKAYIKSYQAKNKASTLIPKETVE